MDGFSATAIEAEPRLRPPVLCPEVASETVGERNGLAFARRLSLKHCAALRQDQEGRPGHHADLGGPIGVR